MNWEVICADVLDWCRDYDGPKFHAILTDPPYHLTPNSGGLSECSECGAKMARRYRYCHQCGAEMDTKAVKSGFMSAAWDGGNLAFQPELWQALACHLHPGGFVFAFASSRGYHRLAVAMEDAGLMYQPDVFVEGVGVVEVPGAVFHLQAQAFPKASRIDAQIEKQRKDDYEPVRKFLKRARDAKGLTNRQVAEPFGFTPTMASHWIDHPTQPSLPSWKQWQRLRALLDFGNEMDAEVKRLNGRKGKPGELWNTREVVDSSDRGIAGGTKQLAGMDNAWGFEGEYDITAPATPLARAWEGHRYGGQILKDCINPIIVAQKPWEGKRLDCIVETGAGSLWVEGGRIQSAVLDSERRTSVPNPGIWGHGKKHPQKEGEERHNPSGRWPSNYAVCHSPQCQRLEGVRRVKATRSDNERTNISGSVYGGGQGLPAGITVSGVSDPDGLEPIARYRCLRTCTCGHQWLAEDAEACPECGGEGEWGCAVRRLGEDSGEKRFSYATNEGHASSIYGSDGQVTRSVIHKDRQGEKGTAARFFPNPDFSHETAERLAMGPVRKFQAKPSRAERDAGLGELSEEGTIRVNAPRRCEAEKFSPRRNPHPTLKSLSLCKWLATLLLPPAIYAPRRLLVPFAGTDSEGIGGLLAGWEHVTMIEQSQEYCTIGEARCRFWQGWSERSGETEPKAILKAARKGEVKEQKQEARQLRLEVLKDDH